MNIRKTVSLLFASALAAGLGIGLGGSAQASSNPTTPSPIWNEIFTPFDNTSSNTMCVDVPSGSMSAGTALQLFHCHGYASNGVPQRWHFASMGSWLGIGPLYQIWNTNSGLCIGFAGNFEASGTRLVQESCGQAPEWAVYSRNPNGVDPEFELIALNTGLCMAAGNLSDANQTPLVATTCKPFSDLTQILELG